MPTLRQNQFGVNVGGPLKRDRTFFFFSYEGQRIRKAQTQTFSVPTAALRAGDFSSARDAALRSADAHGGGHAARPLPATRFRRIGLSPVALALLAKVPLPTSAGSVQNLLAVEDQVNPMNQFSLKVDHRLGASDNLYGRVTTYRVDDTQPFGTTSLNEALVPGFGRTVTTQSENVALGHTHTFGLELAERSPLRLSRARGGQVSPNQGVDFAALSGPAGRDPELSRHGLSAGVLRRTVQRDRRPDVVRLPREPQLRAVRQRHVRPRQSPLQVRRLSVSPRVQSGHSDQCDGAISPSTASGRATRSPTSCSAIRACRRSASAAPTSMVAAPGSTSTGRTTGRSDSNLTLNYGLRYEINSQMTDVDNRLSAIDLPGRRFVIASDENGQLSPTAAPLLSADPDSLRDVGGRRVDARAAAAELPAVRASTGRRVGDRRRRARPSSTPVSACSSTSGPTASSRRSPRRCRSSLRRRSRPPRTRFSRRRRHPPCCSAPANGTVGGSTMDWDFRTEYAKNYSVSVQRQIAPTTMVEVSFLRSAIVGADSSTVRNVPEPGPGADRAAPAGPAAGQHHRDSLGRLFDLQRRDVPGRAAAVARAGVLGLILAVEGHRRCVGSRRHVVRSQPAAGCAQHGRRGRDGQLRPPAPFRRQRHLCPAEFRRQGNGFASKLGSDWQVNAIVLLESGAPFTVNLGHRPGEHRRRPGAASRS